MASFIVFLLIAAVLLMIWQERKTGVTAAPTLPQMSRMMLEACPRQVTGDILELGTGWGGLALKLGWKYPDNQIIGYEISLVPYFFSKIRLNLSGLKNVEIRRQDFFQSDFGRAGLVVCYLSNPHMARLEAKLREELPEGATVVSSTFHCPNWAPLRTIEVPRLVKAQIFVYEQKHD